MGLSCAFGALIFVAGITAPLSAGGASLDLSGLQRPVLAPVQQSLQSSYAAERSGKLTEALALTYLAVPTELVRLQVSEGPHEELVPFLDEAIRRWNTAAGTPLFARAHGRSAPDFYVSFMEEASFAGHAGLIKIKGRYTIQGNEVVATRSGAITVAREVFGTPLTDEEKITVLMHEMGHILGLDDVADTGFLMSPLKRLQPVRGPTQAEIATVLELRRMASQRAQLLRSR